MIFLVCMTSVSELSFHKSLCTIWDITLTEELMFCCRMLTQILGMELNDSYTSSILRGVLVVLIFGKDKIIQSGKQLSILIFVFLDRYYLFESFSQYWHWFPVRWGACSLGKFIEEKLWRKDVSLHQYLFRTVVEMQGMKTLVTKCKAISKYNIWTRDVKSWPSGPEYILHMKTILIISVMWCKKC